MALLPILAAPHPVLKKKAREVRDDEFGPDLAKHFEDMAETMYAAPGVGLAAPQVNDPRQILVADPGFEGEDGDDNKGDQLVYMANPVIVSRSKETITWSEACLSVPDYSQDIRRAREIVVRFQDAEGTVFENTYTDFPAVVIQHEMDHLKGITLLERSSRFKRNRYMQRQKKKEMNAAKGKPRRR
ncbi:MAG: peptide deformylase [Deltaproteobacteria bacterium]|nr:peptide deformylase [Deltaproteobacteria bacterium]HCH63465.1 peptide deformylase [Deltaproteobacteria bacterium]